MIMRILFFTFFITIYSFILNAEIVNDVVVNNNKRIVKESIISLGGIKLGNDYDQSDLDKVLKNLYETNFFSDIKISVENNKMIIYVEENKIIQTVADDNNIYFIDIASSISQNKNYFVDEVHYTALGINAISNLINPELLELLKDEILAK